MGSLVPRPTSARHFIWAKFGPNKMVGGSGSGYETRSVGYPRLCMWLDKPALFDNHYHTVYCLLFMFVC